MMNVLEAGKAPCKSVRAQVLEKASDSVTGQREQDYGSPEYNFAIIANLWSDYLNAEVTAIDVSMMMILLKVARVKNGGGTEDSFVDIACYAACGWEIHDIQKRMDDERERFVK